ncbi:MAG: hypothetical protein KDA28_12765, partial [Phycisphaerales bacterium]|nr:hypothetical protein [Phycisphaerales bacterium]
IGATRPRLEAHPYQPTSMDFGPTHRVDCRQVFHQETPMILAIAGPRAALNPNLIVRIGTRVRTALGSI